ncbi:NUA3_2 [Sanghuangporus weigelae]
MPESESWKSEWGGALELYPVKPGPDGVPEYTSTSTAYTPYPDIDLVLRRNPFAPLSSFLDPIYLQPKVIASLSKKFVDQSSIELHKFLCPPLVAKLEAGLRARDKEDGLDGETRKGRVPLHSSGIRENGPWTLRGPPHKARYCSLVSSSAAGPSTQINETEALTTVYSPTSTPEQILSVPLLPTKYSAQARRFAPGLDYTLATSNNEQDILDVVLGPTPESEEEKMQKREREERELRKGKGREVVNGKNVIPQRQREERRKRRN